MKSKAIINNKLFQKFKKSSIYIVHAKHSVPKIVPSRMVKQPKQQSTFQVNSESIDQVLRAIESQINEQKEMSILICEKIKHHLICLKLKIITRESNKQNKDQTNQIPLTRSFSTHFFRKPISGPLASHIKQKQTHCLLESPQKQNFQRKLTKTKCKGGMEQIHTIDQKMKALNEKLEVYQKDYPILAKKLHELELKFQQIQAEKQALIKQYNQRMDQKRQCQYKLRQCLTKVEQEFKSTKRKLSLTQAHLNQREIEIINMWHALLK